MTIGIIASMQEEFDALLEHISNGNIQKKAIYTFHRGNWGKQDMVLLFSGIGKVNATVGTTLLIENFTLDAVINTGVTGGLDSALDVGDIVISTAVRQHDVDATAFGYEAGQIPGMPAVYNADPDLLAAAGRVHPKGAALHRGLIVSGDRFLHTAEDVESLRRRFPEPLACEMEAGAVAQTCYLFGKPFIIVRAVSDIVMNKDNTKGYEESLSAAARASAAFVSDMIKYL